MQAVKSVVIVRASAGSPEPWPLQRGLYGTKKKRPTNKLHYNQEEFEQCSKASIEVIKNVMLNSTEHVIYPANWHFNIC